MIVREVHQSWLHSIFSDLGIDMEDENFEDTPRRWLKALGHYLQPYDPGNDLGVTFSVRQVTADGTAATRSVQDKYKRAMVVQTGIPYRALCAHHLLPVLGTAHVGYIPGGRVVGLSKLARVVYGFSHAMPSLQEHVTTQITDALEHYLQPIGAMCVIEAEHGCMGCRGVEEPGVSTVTSSLGGVFITDAAARQEFYTLMNMRAKR